MVVKMHKERKRRLIITLGEIKATPLEFSYQSIR